MNRTEVKLNTLSDTDRSRTKNKNLLSSLRLFRLILASKNRIIIWCSCCKLCCTCINHLKGCCDAIVIAHLLYLILSLAA